MDEKTLTELSIQLQGRPRLTATFIQRLWNASKDNKEVNVKNELNLYKQMMVCDTTNPNTGHPTTFAQAWQHIFHNATTMGKKLF